MMNQIKIFQILWILRHFHGRYCRLIALGRTLEEKLSIKLISLMAFIHYLLEHSAYFRFCMNAKMKV